ncbi:hypothetical protein R3P38DRAFT_3483345 [Favolaschia claudopus]|uniref:Uncharacterized protein n=1 Tax=Favolaschia claudopus TaxID=2862362 RepID=A0AAW0C9B4_9AGAR
MRVPVERTVALRPRVKLRSQPFPSVFPVHGQVHKASRFVPARYSARHPPPSHALTSSVHSPPSKAMPLRALSRCSCPRFTTSASINRPLRLALPSSTTHPPSKTALKMAASTDTDGCGLRTCTSALPLFLAFEQITAFFLSLTRNAYPPRARACTRQRAVHPALFEIEIESSGMTLAAGDGRRIERRRFWSDACEVPRLMGHFLWVSSTRPRDSAAPLRLLFRFPYLSLYLHETVPSWSPTIAPSRLRLRVLRTSLLPRNRVRRGFGVYSMDELSAFRLRSETPVRTRRGSVDARYAKGDGGGGDRRYPLARTAWFLTKRHADHAEVDLLAMNGAVDETFGLKGRQQDCLPYTPQDSLSFRWGAQPKLSHPSALTHDTRGHASIGESLSHHVHRCTIPLHRDEQHLFPASPGFDFKPVLASATYTTSDADVYPDLP